MTGRDPPSVWSFFHLKTKGLVSTLHGATRVLSSTNLRHSPSNLHLRLSPDDMGSRSKSDSGRLPSPPLSPPFLCPNAWPAPDRRWFPQREFGPTVSRLLSETQFRMVATINRNSAATCRSIPAIAFRRRSESRPVLQPLPTDQVDAAPVQRPNSSMLHRLRLS